MSILAFHVSMKALNIFFVLTLFFQTSVHAQRVLASGKQPQMALDAKGVLRLVYGEKEKIFCTESNDNGITFTKPVLVAEVPGMHLGMSRGPQIASSANYSMITAMDKSGNIYSFMLDHKKKQWVKAARINDHVDSAPEGLMGLASDDKNRFYAVWLDLRNDRKNNICISSFDNKRWSPNKFAYVSDEDHVCECCKPSISVNGSSVAIMFRNWLKGSRDLYVTTSDNRGETFSPATKLGNGTWQLKGCPMDGGGISIDSQKQIHTAWQRDGVVFYAQPGQTEERIGDGRNISLNGNVITWQNGTALMIKEINGPSKSIGEGTALQAIRMKDGSIFAVWEKDNTVVYKKIK
jgi:hypothetical protein